MYTLGKEFGGDVDVNEDAATYHVPRHVHGSVHEVVLGNKTDQFMQKFKCQTFSKLNQYHVDILREQSATVAFSRINGVDYMVATKSQDMVELKRKLFSKTNQRSQHEQPSPLMNLHLSQK
jgi:hypothetical protein